MSELNLNPSPYDDAILLSAFIRELQNGMTVETLAEALSISEGLKAHEEWKFGLVARFMIRARSIMISAIELSSQHRRRHGGGSEVRARAAKLEIISRADNTEKKIKT